MTFPDHTVQTRWPSPLGTLTLAACPEALVGVWFDDQAHRPDLSDCPQANENTLAQNAVLQAATTQLAEYFAGQRRRFELPLSTAGGTEFQQAVWLALPSIAPGSTCSYATLAGRIGHPTAVRAVGAAVGRNPLCVVLPCHRVIGASGHLTGYAGGFQRKTALLKLEGAI